METLADLKLHRDNRGNDLVAPGHCCCAPCNFLIVTTCTHRGALYKGEITSEANCAFKNLVSGQDLENCKPN